MVAGGGGQEAGTISGGDMEEPGSHCFRSDLVPVDDDSIGVEIGIGRSGFHGIWSRLLLRAGRLGVGQRSARVNPLCPGRRKHSERVLN